MNLSLLYLLPLWLFCSIQYYHMKYISVKTHCLKVLIERLWALRMYICDFLSSWQHPISQNYPYKDFRHNNANLQPTVALYSHHIVNKQWHTCKQSIYLYIVCVFAAHICVLYPQDKQSLYLGRFYSEHNASIMYHTMGIFIWDIFIWGRKHKIPPLVSDILEPFTS